MQSVDVPVALLGYGTVGAAVHRLLSEQGDEIERATGHRLRVVRALVRDGSKERTFAPGSGVLTTDPADVLGDPSLAIVAEVMGGVEPAGAYVLELLRTGRSVVTANKQLVARRAAELFAAAAESGAHLRFEALHHGRTVLEGEDVNDVLARAYAYLRERVPAADRERARLRVTWGMVITLRAVQLDGGPLWVGPVTIHAVFVRVGGEP